MILKLQLFLVLVNFLFFFGNCENDILRVAKDYSHYLLVVTVDGTIYLMDKYSGEQMWSLRLEQFTRTKNSNGSMLIPNPISGSLFIFTESEKNNLFTRLEHSMFEYVRQTPIFIDGLLMTGSKSDQWLTVDLDTGKLIHKLKTGYLDNCPQQDSDEVRHLLHLGICQYSLLILDPTTRRIIYDVMLNTLSTHTTSDISNNNLKFFVSSDTGLIFTKYKVKSFEKGWTYTFNSSVIGVYSITDHGILNRLEFTSMSHDTLLYLFYGKSNWKENKLDLKKAMFFGQKNDNWYVIKTYIHQSVKIRTVAHRNTLLITGPMNESVHYISMDDDDSKLSTGFYEIPLKKIFIHYNYSVPHRYLLDFDKKYVTNAIVVKLMDDFLPHVDISYEKTDKWLLMIGYLVVATFIMTGFILSLMMMQKIRGSKDNISSNTHFYEYKPQNDGDGFSVGDLIYYPNDVLGYGTNGTTVFRGLFRGNGKIVAVKRLIKTDQSQHELQFLRQSFDCSNLIKCYYITHSREFTFLALEFCECTLETYVLNENFRIISGLGKWNACNQLMCAVSFLHEKSIVHRDLKPRNVLLMKQVRGSIRSVSNTTTTSDSYKYKIVISDFGLSRQSSNDGISITKTGSGGTSGYMAPEQSKDEIKRITPSCDIFSCGILFYYIHTDGQHPFGSDVLSRQHHINGGVFQFNANIIKDRLLIYFVQGMLELDPTKRPTAEEILHGPLFWNTTKKLSFICEVSDFVENADIDLQVSLDNRSTNVYKNKWTDCLEPEFITSFTVQRVYKTRHLTHLIRAVRNKRNHFHDLPPDISEQLFHGSINGFFSYIENKFPNLFPVLFGWVRNHLEYFPDSIHNFFPLSIVSHQIDLNDRKPSTTPDTVSANQSVSDFLEWRKSKRRRPNQPKKQRGMKSRTVDI